MNSIIQKFKTCYNVTTIQLKASIENDINTKKIMRSITDIIVFDRSGLIKIKACPDYTNIKYVRGKVRNILMSDIKTDLYLRHYLIHRRYSMEAIRCPSMQYGTIIRL